MNFTLSEGQPRKNRAEHRLIFSFNSSDYWIDVNLIYRIDS